MQLTVISFLLTSLISLSLVLPGPAVTRSKTATVAHLQQSPGKVSTQIPGDRGWPRGYNLPSEAQMVVYQPQIATWENQKHAVALAAVSVIGKGETKPALGTIKIETDTEVSLEQRLVRFTNIKITETNFQTLAKEKTQEVVAQLEKNISDQDRLIALDRVLAYVDKSSMNPKNVDGLKSDP